MTSFYTPMQAPASDAPAGGRAGVEISDQWDILGYPNGGYLAAMAASAMAGRLEHTDPLTICASFLGHPKAGKGELDIAVIDVKKSMSRATTMLAQEGENKAFYVASYTDFSRMGGTSVIGAAAVAQVAREACVPAVSLPYPPMPPAFLAQFDLRIKRGQLSEPRPGNEAKLEGWIDFADGRPVDLFGLILMCDAFPPPIFNCLAPQDWGSVPTIEYSVHLKAMPAPGPIHGRFVAAHMVNEYLEIDGELSDVNGNVVALSRQIAKYRKRA
jgi:hypothetical protein